MMTNAPHDFLAVPPVRETASRLRVLFIPQWYPARSGPNQVTGTFCREHVRAASLYDDVAVLVLTSRLQRWPTLQWERVEDLGVPTFYVTFGRSPIPKTTSLFLSWHLRRAFRRVIEEWGLPDVVHTQDIQAYFVIRALRCFGLPFVISQHWSGFLERIISRTSLRRYRWAFGQAALCPPNEQIRSRGLSTLWSPTAYELVAQCPGYGGLPAITHTGERALALARIWTDPREACSRHHPRVCSSVP